MNDIEILQNMLTRDAQVSLHHGLDATPSVKLTDRQSRATVEIAKLPQDSIVIRADAFELPTVFMSSKGARRRADFVIVSNEERGKWIVCIETQAGTSKDRAYVATQLKGAHCFISYCKCIGKVFWESQGFLDDYQYRYVSIANINTNKQRTRLGSPDSNSNEKPHDSPDAFREIFERQNLYFDELTS